MKLGWAPAAPGTRKQGQSAHVDQGKTKVRDGETTIKIKFPFFEGVGAWRQRGKSSKTLFFLRSATTIKF